VRSVKPWIPVFTGMTGGGAKSKNLCVLSALAVKESAGICVNQRPIKIKYFSQIYCKVDIKFGIM